MPVIESSGRYAEYCEKWEEAFGASNCLYVRQHLLESNSQSAIDEICDFIGVPRIRLPSEARGRFGQNHQPPIMAVARLSAAAAARLRASGLHRIVESAKSLGLKRILLGPPAKPDRMPEEVQQHLFALHAEDIAFLRRRFGDLEWEGDVAPNTLRSP